MAKHRALPVDVMRARIRVEHVHVDVDVELVADAVEAIELAQTASVH